MVIHSSNEILLFKISNHNNNNTNNNDFIHLYKLIHTKIKDPKIR